MKTLYAACLCLGLVAVVQAQQTLESKPPLPPGPLIQKRAPEFAPWAIKMAGTATAGKAAPSSGKEKEAPAPWGQTILMIKTGRIMLRQTTDEKMQVWNTWVLGEQDIQTTISPDGKSWVVQSGNPDPNTPAPNYEDYSRTDFPKFEWVAEKNYAGIRNVGGRRCLLFVDRVKLLSDDPEPTAVSAYIDLETRLPVALNQGGDARTYEFRAAPSAPLTLPPLVQGLLDNRKKLAQSVTRKAIRSF